MIRKLLAIVTLVFVVGVAVAQEIACFTYCKASSAFSADNVHLIRSLGAEPPWMTFDFRWHQTEPILFMLSDWSWTEEDATAGAALEMWEYEDGGYKSRNLLIRRPFTQLEVTLDSVIAGTDSGSLLFWDIKQEAILHEFPVSDGEFSELLLHPNNEWLLIAIDNAQLFQFDLETQSVIEIQVKGAEEIALHVLSFSNDGHLLAGGGQGLIRIWDTRSWDEWEPKHLPAESVGDVLFTIDDSHLIVVADASVSRWSLGDDRLIFLRELEAHPNKRPCHFTDGDISPQGRLLMTTDSCGQFRAWDLAADAEIYIPQLDFSDEGNPGIAAVFSPDGRFLAKVTDGYWGLLIVWEGV